MADSSSTPDTVNLIGYAGDTLTRRIEIGGDDPAAFIAGRTWSAQIRSADDAATIDATFDIDDDATGATITLTAEDSAALVAGAPALMMTGRSARITRADVGITPMTVTGGVYTGVWDVQLAPPGGGDPTTTLVRGTVTITHDVTRLP